MTGNRFAALFSERKEGVSYMLREISHICRHMARRAPGSEGEREAAEYLAGLLKKDCGCGDIRVEPFREHPAAFYGYFRFSMALDILCALGFFLSPWLSILFGGLALFLFIAQFGLYKQIIDPLFPEKESVNVTAIRQCAGECRQRILLNGHIDAAWEFPLNYRFGGIAFEIPGVVALIGVLFYLALSVASVCGAGSRAASLAPWGLISLPFFLLVGCTYDPRRTVDGANDDLTGCFMGIALLREMERLGIVPEHTELGVILTGSEEAGLRGAKAWSDAHSGGFRDVPTWILCFDTIHDPRHLMVNVRDLNGTVKADPLLCSAFLKAAEDVGVPCRRGWVPPFGGSTDSAAFSRGGFRSAGITGLNHKLEDYYHTRRDSYDNLDRTGLENCYLALLRFIENAEEGDGPA
jgi:hypothetical protein